MVQPKKKCAIYCRVSTADQNTDRQEKELLEYAQKMDYEIYGVFTEIASGAKNDRKERAKIIKLAQARKIDIVLVTETTRWGRSTQDLLSTVQELESRGVSLVSLTGISFDFSTAQGKLIATVIAALAEFERDLLTERIKSGVAAAQARGKHCGRPKGRISDKVQRITPKIRKMRDEGYTIRSIAKHLRCSPQTVQQILKEAK